MGGKNCTTRWRNNRGSGCTVPRVHPSSATECMRTPSGSSHKAKPRALRTRACHAPSFSETQMATTSKKMGSQTLMTAMMATAMMTQHPLPLHLHEECLVGAWTVPLQHVVVGPQQKAKLPGREAREEEGGDNKWRGSKLGDVCGSAILFGPIGLNHFSPFPLTVPCAVP